MFSWYGCIFIVWTVETVQFGNRVARPTDDDDNIRHTFTGELSKRQYIPGLYIKTAAGPIPTLMNVNEDEQNMKAAYKGLTSYDGDIVEPKYAFKPVGYPVPLDIDKEPDEEGPAPLFNLFNKQYTGERKDSNTRHSPDTKKPGKKEKENKKHGRKIYDKNNDGKFTLQNIKIKDRLTEFLQHVVGVSPGTNTSATNRVVENKHSKDGDKASAHVPLEKSFVCFLPKIVIKTKLLGTTVINEVEIYGNSHNKNSVHRFLSTHNVGDDTSELSNEFILPPQFIMGVPKELEDANDITVVNTAAYTDKGKLRIPKIVYKRPPDDKTIDTSKTGSTLLSSRVAYKGTGPLRNTTQSHSPSSKTSRTTARPTFNPFLPTTAPAKTYNPYIPATDSPGTREQYKVPLSNILLPTSAAGEPRSIRRKPRLKDIQDFIKLLNYKARHRNPQLDIPGADTSALTGYQMMSPLTSV